MIADGFSLLSTNWYFNNYCANLYYNRTDTIVDIYISTKFIAFLYRTDTKVEIMFKFTLKFSDDFKTEASSILNPVLTDGYSFFITEFKVVKQSAIVGETQYYTLLAQTINNLSMFMFMRIDCIKKK